MHDVLLSILLGVIEGVTEFLPVSSTAHLRIAEWLLKLPLSDPFWKTYSVVIQLGAILAVVVYFRARILELVKTFPKGTSGDRTILTHPISLVMIAFVVTAGPCYLADKKISANLENLTVIGGALVIGGAIMWAVDVLCTRHRTDHMEQMSLFQALVVGAAQILSAAFPGTSRSMITIAGGQVVGMSRASALEFSFFLSIPTMLAATLYKLVSPMLKGESISLSGHEWTVLLVGLVVSFIVAWGVIAWFMAWVRKHGFIPFAIYRIVLGAAILIALRFA